MTDLDPVRIDLGPFARLLGLQLTAASGSAIAGEWAVSDELLQPFGLLHGGVHCAVVETLASVGAALWFDDRGTVVGVHNGTDFFRATRPGDRLSSVGRPVHQGRSQQLWRVETHDTVGRLVAAGEVRIQNLAHPTPSTSNP